MVRDPAKRSTCKPTPWLYKLPAAAGVSAGFNSGQTVSVNVCVVRKRGERRDAISSGTARKLRPEATSGTLIRAKQGGLGMTLAAYASVRSLALRGGLPGC